MRFVGGAGAFRQELGRVGPTFSFWESPIEHGTAVLEALVDPGGVVSFQICLRNTGDVSYA